MKNIHILLVEDEESLASFISDELGFEGYLVTIAKDGEEALAKFEEFSDQLTLLLLDWMLPKLDGLAVCRRIRRKSEIPIIMMTARDYVGDKVAGLDGGADDYITKPFEIEELLARIRVIIRRKELECSKQEQSVYQVADLKLDLRKRIVERFGETFRLTQREFDLLYELIKNAGEVLSREELLNKAWGYDYFGQTNIVDVYIRSLRNKIDYQEERTLIQTVRGVGYTLREEK